MACHHVLPTPFPKAAWVVRTFFCPPPQLRGVREVRTLVGLVARMGTHLVGSGLEVALSYLVARIPPRGREVWRIFFEGFAPGEIGVPGSLLKFFHGYPPRVCGCVR